jgi:beta-aspartyl-peptidase (threonine type)
MRVERRRVVARRGVALTLAALAWAGVAWNTHVEPRAAAQSAGESSSGDAAIRAAVEAVLQVQQAAWNRGDVDEFVEHYWKSDDLTFSGGGKTTRGWTATRDRYRDRYPTREAMGQLTFGNLEITPLGDAAAMVLGEWALARDDDPVGGNFTLVMRMVDARWVIIHDHTSQLVK